MVCWNGTKGAGLGLPVDKALCTMMAEAAGVPATTTSLATGTLLQRLGAQRIGLVVPGATEYARPPAPASTHWGWRRWRCAGWG
ncbi:hypothetical protein ACFQU2_11845 [Siccirubricoccus deserti]